MEPVVNLEEQPGKVVGKPRRLSFGQFLAQMAQRCRSLGVKLPYPKGVYRFETFEEANAWEWNHMMAAAKKRSLARHSSRT